MSTPLLTLDHEWHRQRANLRVAGPGRVGLGQLRPPPLVAAGLEIDHDEHGRRVRVGGLIVIFGHFPATLRDFVALARARLHLQPEQARELDPILNTRVMALWAWLPTVRRDCYLEFDRATGTIETWLVGPGPGDIEAIEVEAEESAVPPNSDELDQWFLEGLVLNGHAHWGGERGLAQLVERFGRTALLVAAQVADHLEHRAEDPASALQVARTRWPALNDEDEVPWAAVAEASAAERRDDPGHPFICAQLGRLALRLGLLRAARALLSASAGSTDVSPIAWFDLGQACEALDDLTGAENAFTRYASARPQDPDAWRRLLFCRLRRDRGQLAEECLRKYHSAGGKDDELVERYLHVVARGRIRTDQRGFLAAFLLPHLRVAFAAAGHEGDVEREIVRLCFCDDPSSAAAFTALVSRVRGQLAVTLRLSGNEHYTEDAVRSVLLTLPFLGPLHPDDESADVETLADDVQSAINRWAEAPTIAAALMGPPPVVDSRSLFALAAMANGVWDDHESDAYSDSYAEAEADNDEEADDDLDPPEEHR